MKNTFIGFFRVCLITFVSLMASNSHAVTISDTPAYITASVPPLVMLAMTKDHQLFYKAYNDFTDLNGDGTIETTYTHSFDYYGYFDPYKCYTYNTSGYFVPSSVTTDKYCTAGSSLWSGNFLNWASMTRMDVLRKLLYGGYRSSDPTTGVTTLERVYLPTEAHSFAKYYNGSDINKLTPFTVSTTAPTGTSTTSITIATASTSTDPGCSGSTCRYVTVSSSTLSGVAVGDQILIARTTDSTKYMKGIVSSLGSSGGFTFYVAESGGVGSGPYTNWTITDYTQTGISLCNTTPAYGSSQHSQSLSTTSYPPLIRVAKGNYALWSANERWQCAWTSEKTATESSFSVLQSNGNNFAASGLYASSENPSGSTQGLGSINFTARVQVCNTTVGLESNCKAYPSGNYKPTGLLQKYGDDGTIKFGLTTGTYSKNISGGVVRKNVRDMTDEVNTTTDGTFTGTAGIVSTLNKMRLYGYTYSDGTYTGDDNCTYQQIGIVTSGGSATGGYPANEGNCSSWGNPMSEIFLESLRYFAGKTADSRFVPGSSSKDGTLGLPAPAWTDPLTSSNYCSPLNVILINASSASYDNDQMDKISDLGSTQTAAQWTKTLGDLEGITGGTYFIGDNGVTADGLCSGKTVSNFGTIKGVCPDTPSLSGSFLMSGTAWYAHTNKIRSDAVALAVPASDKKSLKVSTYAVQLASNTPTIRLPVPGSTTGKTVTLIPAYRLDRTDVATGRYGTGTIVDFKIIQPYTLSGSTATGSFYVNWEDSNQGGDYDQDLWGLVSYSITSSTVTVTTRVIARAGANPQGFGYIISGTNKDGAHFHSGAYGFNFTDPTGALGCTGCGATIPSPPTSYTYTLGTAGSAGSLQDPLWYAAKWGGFLDTDSDTLAGGAAPIPPSPNLTSEWDAYTSSGASGSDGIPDNYFYVTNPGALEDALEKALFAILRESSASAVATNSTSLKTDLLIFQAVFNPKDWSGQLLASSLTTSSASSSGVSSASPTPIVVTTTLKWDAGVQINTQSPSSRTILTLNGDTGRGMPFTWTDISGLTSTTQRDALNANSAGTPDGYGSLRVSYLRGDQTHESLTGLAPYFRQRPTSVLGDIIYSNPLYVSAPDDGYVDSSYATFRSTYLNRLPVIYVGSNDGMLHGFNACYPLGGTCTTSTWGTEVLAYVPGKVYGNLSKLTDPKYSHKFFVDGSPTVKDAYGAFAGCALRGGGSACWGSILVAGLNAGGQGVFALDITDPTSFSAGNADKLLLWEFTNTDDGDLGYTYSKPVIGRICTARSSTGACTASIPVAIFGNGYNSASSTAALYILRLDKTAGSAWSLGTNFYKLNTGSTTANGLSTATVWDTNGDGFIDYVYAGDLQGNVWKFDVSSTTPSSWKVAFGTGPVFTPLFTAKDGATTPNAQPITTAPALTAHPLSGIMVFFGTGKILASADMTDTKTQTFYGIWDKDDGTTTVPGRSSLLAQTIDSQSTVTGTVETTTSRYTSNNPMNWRTATSIAPDYLGWYMDLIVAPPPTSSNMKGERVVGTPQLKNGAILFNTFIPSTLTCDYGGDGFYMALNYVNGGLLGFPVFDTNGDGTITSADAPTGGTRVGAALGGTTLLFPPSGGLSTGSGSGGGTTSGGTSYSYGGGTVGSSSAAGTPPNECPAGTSPVIGVSATTASTFGSIIANLGSLCGRITWRELSK